MDWFLYDNSLRLERINMLFCDIAADDNNLKMMIIKNEIQKSFWIYLRIHIGFSHVYTSFVAMIC